MPERIPLLDLVAQHRALAEPLRQATLAAIDRAAFIGGAAVEEFEHSFARFCGVSGCVGVGNGTDALMLALRVLGVGPGDTVLVPAATFIATAEAVTALGATLRFVDIDPHTYTLCSQRLQATDPGGVRAVIAVHLYGQAADMTPITTWARARGWAVIEDAAQAHGATYEGRSIGSHGDLAAFSFYPGKNLGAMGDAGAVVGPDGPLLQRVRVLANHGRGPGGRNEHIEPGCNSRLDAIQAAALSVKLPHLQAWNQTRVRVAGWYAERLRDCPGVRLPAVGLGRTHVYHQFVVQVDGRDQLRKALAAANIDSAIHYSRPLHLQPAYQSIGYGEGAFPVAEALTRRCISLPMYPELREQDVDRVVHVVREHVRAGG